MTKYRCIVATPIRQLFAGEIEYANIPGIEGNYGVLANHEQFVGLNRPGVLSLTIDEASGEKKEFAIYGGITQVFNNHLSILADMGRLMDEIDIEETKEKLAHAKAELERIGQEDSKADETQTDIRNEYIDWCEMQIKLKEGQII